MKSAAKTAGPAASKLISEKIAELGDWRGKTLARMRALIKETDPDVLEEWKWMGTPVWSHDGGICTGESYKAVVKLTFFKGAALADPAKLFNSSLDGNVRRAIDIREGEEINTKAFKALIKEAIALNVSSKKPKASAAKAEVSLREICKANVRPRLAFIALALCTIALGLWVHGYMALGDVARDVVGDALWATMIAWWVGALTPRSRLIARSAAAYGICLTVELSQLLHTPSLDAVRETTLGHLVLGSGFDPRDIAAYALGVTFAAVCERVVRKR